VTVETVLEIHGLTKNYSSLRPLRITALTVGAGERVTIGGLDAGAGELLVNLVTGALLPDFGHIRVFGQPTSAIENGDAWLDSLERFGIVSPRGVLLEGSTLAQNLAMPFTLSIDPIPPDVAQQVRRLAQRCGIDPERWLEAQVGGLPADVRVRAHLARALALNPRLLLIEHPTVDVEEAARRPLAQDIAKACLEGDVTTIVLTNDVEFARAVGPRNLKLDGATGILKPISKGWLSW
jgi:phospholipid/cholesterol/gamma-HCH transport system ATP-binding protein